MSINQRQNLSNQHLVKVWDYTLLKEKRDRKKEVLYLKSQGIEAGDKELMEERDGLYFLFFWRLLPLQDPVGLKPSASLGEEA